MFWKKSHSKQKGSTDLESRNEYNNLIKRLFDMPVYEPRHEEIQFPEKGDVIYKWADLEEHLWAFEYLKNFAKHVNKFYAPGETYNIGPWRLEQMSSAELLMVDYDGPVLGLRFRIFYGSVLVGSLEIEPQLTKVFNAPDEYHRAALHVELEYAPFFPYRHIHGFLEVCSDRFEAYQEDEYSDNRLDAINHAIIHVLWESNRQDTMWFPLDFSYSGTICQKAHYGR